VTINSGFSASLSWSTRMEIVVGAVKGLAFLHEAEKPVIYRDFKASNILLGSVSLTFILLYCSIKISFSQLYVEVHNTYLYVFI